MPELLKQSNEKQGFFTFELAIFEFNIAAATEDHGESHSYLVPLLCCGTKTQKLRFVSIAAELQICVSGQSPNTR